MVFTRMYSSIPRTRSSSSIVGRGGGKKRLAYYDHDAQKVRTRVFNTLEITAANNVFGTVEEILLENGYTMKDKWISSGKCGCQKHLDTYFVIELKEDTLSLDTIHEIEESLGSDVKPAYVVACKHRRNVFIQLAVIQKHISEKSETTADDDDSS